MDYDTKKSNEVMEDDGDLAGEASLYSRASRTFNTLPEYLRDNTQSINVFKTNLKKHYLDLTLTVYDPAVPQTLKSVCIKCHTSRPLTALLVKLCC